MSRSESQKLRNLGNQVYQKNRLPEALEYYSQVSNDDHYLAVITIIYLVRASAWPPIPSPPTPT